MENGFKQWIRREDGLSAFQIISTIAIIGVILTLVVPAVSWLSKDYSPEKHRANAIEITEAVKSYIIAHGYKPGTNAAITVYDYDSQAKAKKDTSLAANSYMIVSLKDLRQTGSFAAVKDPQTGEEYDQDKTLIYIQQDDKQQQNVWMTLASGSTNYFDKMRYEDILDGDAKVNQ